MNGSTPITPADRERIGKITEVVARLSLEAEGLAERQPGPNRRAVCRRIASELRGVVEALLDIALDLTPGEKEGGGA